MDRKSIMPFIDDIFRYCRISNLKKHIWGDCIHNYKHGAHFLNRFFLEFCSSDLHKAILLVARRGVSRFNNTWKFNLDLVVKIASFVLCRMHML